MTSREHITELYDVLSQTCRWRMFFTPPEPKRAPIAKEPPSLTPTEALILDTIIEHPSAIGSELIGFSGLGHYIVRDALVRFKKRGWIDGKGVAGNRVAWTITPAGREAAITPQTWAWAGEGDDASERA